jgi:hypothetical protein
MASALRTLERPARDGRRPGLPACPPDWYPPDQAEAGFEELDRVHLENTRRRGSGCGRSGMAARGSLRLPLVVQSGSYQDFAARCRIHAKACVGRDLCSSSIAIQRGSSPG